MDIVSILKNEWSVISQAPISIFLITIGVGILIWRFASHTYSNRLEDANSKMDLLTTELNNYKDKLGGATPDDAKARLDELEAKIIQLEPRKISAKQRELMMTILRSHSGESIIIAADAASPDAQHLQKGLETTFRRSDWNVITPMIMGVVNSPPTGIGFGVPDPVNLTVEQSNIIEALNAANLDFDLQKNPLSQRPTESVGEITLTTRTDA